MNKSVQLAGYADDIDILGRSVCSIKEAFLNLEEAAKEIGLKVNAEKTKVMLQSRWQRNRLGQTLTVGEHNLEVTREFSYLNTKLTWNNDKEAEIQKRITAPTKSYCSLLPILRSKNIHIKTKLRLYKTMIRTMMVYDGKTWTITSGGAEN